jgi:glycosyltransferase involved in cell wall biosynthesis
LNVPFDNIDIIRPALDSDFLMTSTNEIFEKSREIVKSKFGLDKFLLYVSRVEPRKNHDTLLKAYLDLELWRQGYFLIFVGKTSIENPKLELIINSLDSHVKQFVIHYQSVSHDLLLHLLKSTSLFVYPTRAEGFGYPPLEAAAFGVETITSNATCLSEFSFFGDRLFDPDNLDEIKRKIISILFGTFDGPKMSTISEEIRQNFGWSNSASAFEKLIMTNFKSL